jgi:regulator of protease activity HflC (stomatin/prohibitin superfamily)
MFNRYILAMVLSVLVAILLCVVVIYKSFLVYIPPGHTLIIISNNGAELPPNTILAKPGQKGIMEEVFGEGLHAIMPYFYNYEIATLTAIPVGKIGIVTSLVGKQPALGSILVNDDEKGIRRRVLTPGKYRLNPYGYKVQVANAVQIEPGFVGVVTSLIGREPKGMFSDEGEKGIQRNVLQPGMYYLNPHEFKIIPVEIGINQVSFLDSSQIKFPSKDAFDISIEATVEWELLPTNAAQVIAEFGAKDAIEEKVIVPQSKSIGRIQGSNYGAKEFLLGSEREKFQQSFTAGLERTCEAKNIEIHSAFIRQLSIPDNLLLPIRESFVAVQKEKTAKVWEETKKSAGQLERERSLITQARAQVTAQTAAMIDTIMAEADQQVGKIDAGIRLEIAQKQQEIANIEASKTILLGEANATVIKLKGEAVSKGIEAKIKAFGDNPRAYANYYFAKKIPADLKINLIYSGRGTLWTDLEKSAGLTGLGAAQNLQQETPAADNP